MNSIRPAAGQHAGAHLPAEGPAGCGCRVERPAVRGMQKVRTPRHPPDLEQGTVRLSQLRGAPAHRRYYRLSLVLDKGSFRELDADLAPQDVLQFPGYPEKLEAQTGKTG